ncbi:uncharacterized protein J3D65DRAFT_164863 [Phyllosticta citribraziliensis]|uniref:Uncharacterized protein n=1 Tax=Phyllosticta citribraziliensis TaxID=989973 RepID=A0ABR1L8H8_9PEZI
MPSATDLITYIGIPLTVLGLLPIFWNIFQSLLIRHRLSVSMPPEFRHIFDLIANPANGDVIVITRPVFCENPGLWPEFGSDQDDSGRQHLQSWHHKFSLGLHSKIRSAIPAIRSTYDKVFGAPRELIIRFRHREQEVSTSGQISSTPNQISSGLGNILETKTLHTGKQRHLFRPWMSLPFRIGSSPHETEEFAQKYWQKSGATSTAVNINMDISKPPKLMMPWKSFVWFSLAIGVDPLDMYSAKRALELKFSLYKSTIRISKDNDDWHVALEPEISYQFSIPRALAWNNIMCFDRGGLLICRALAKPPVNQLEFKVWGKRNIDVHGQGELCSDVFLSLCGKYEISPDCFSKRLGDKKLSDLVLIDAHSERIHTAATTWIFYLEGLERLSSEAMICPFVSQGMLEAQERSLLALYQLQLDGNLRDKLSQVFPEVYKTELTSTLNNENEEESSTQKMTRRLVDEAHSYLQHEFESSPYLEESKKFVKIFQDLQKQIKRCQEESQLDLSTPLKEIKKIRRHAGQPYTCSRSFDDSSVLGSQQRTSLFLLQRLKETSPLQKLKSEFDPLESKVVVEERSFPSHEMALVAHIMIALQPWQELQRTTWDLNEMAKDRLLTCDRELERQNVDEVIGQLRVLEKYAKMGIFSAPEMGSVVPVLNGYSYNFPEVVYFV